MDPMMRLFREELEERSASEIVCAYRAFCASLLVRTAQIARARCPHRKVELDQKRTAAKWTMGGQGVLTFEEACDAVGMLPEYARNAILDYATAPGGESISMVRQARRRQTYGRRSHDPRPSKPVSLGEAAACT